MPKVRFEIYSTERGKKLIDLAELMMEAGYLENQKECYQLVWVVNLNT